MRRRGVGQVIRSRHHDYREGDIVVASLGWQEYSIRQPRDAGTSKLAQGPPSHTCLVEAEKFTGLLPEVTALEPPVIVERAGNQAPPA
jgi:NADPH-dependent curcumin reductase CurA